MKYYKVLLDTRRLDEEDMKQKLLNVDGLNSDNIEWFYGGNGITYKAMIDMYGENESDLRELLHEFKILWFENYMVE